MEIAERVLRTVHDASEFLVKHWCRHSVASLPPAGEWPSFATSGAAVWRRVTSLSLSVTRLSQCLYSNETCVNAVAVWSGPSYFPPTPSFLLIQLLCLLLYLPVRFLVYLFTYALFILLLLLLLNIIIIIYLFIYLSYCPFMSNNGPAYLVCNGACSGCCLGWRTWRWNNEDLYWLRFVWFDLNRLIGWMILWRQ